MVWVMGRATIQSHSSITLGNIKVVDADFVDDDAIFAESLESLAAPLDAFSN